jgi:hypothetical protein
MKSIFNIGCAVYRTPRSESSNPITAHHVATANRLDSELKPTTARKNAGRPSAHEGRPLLSNERRASSASAAWIAQETGRPATIALVLEHETQFQYKPSANAMIDSTPQPLARPAQPQSVGEAVLLAVSFLGGFQIMALELCGFRILQMNLGTSVVVTGTLLTTIMVLLSAGYYLGGTLERLRSPRALLVLLLTACAYTQFANVVLLERLSDLTLELRDRLDGFEHLQAGLPAALLSLVLYGPPVLALSMISPWLIRRQSEAPSSDAGKQSGFIMSLSTAGSIFGTLLASYVLIPTFGVRSTASWTNALLTGVLLLALFASARSAVANRSITDAHTPGDQDTTRPQAELQR